MTKKDSSKKLKPEPYQDLTFTKRTIKFGPYRYQVRNITYVGIIEYDKKINTVDRWTSTLISSGIGVTTLSVVGGGAFGGGIGLMFILAAILNIAFPKQEEKIRWGLVFETNSGEKRLFINDSKAFLEEVILQFTLIMEGDIEFLSNSTGVNVDFRNGSVLSIGGSVGGNVNSGSVSGNISSSVGGNVS